MIARTQHGRERMLVSLRQGLVACAGVYLLVAAALGAETFMKSTEASSAEHQVKTVKQEIFNTRNEITRAKRLSNAVAPTDLTAVAKLQSKIESLAAERHCAVAEFRASSEAVPYLTRFAKTTSVGGWTQVQAETTLAGSVQNVMASLTGLIDAEIPFEFDSMDISRDQISSVGDATVLCHVTLRVLIRAKESA